MRALTCVGTAPLMTLPNLLRRRQVLVRLPHLAQQALGFLGHRLDLARGEIDVQGELLERRHLGVLLDVPHAMEVMDALLVEAEQLGRYHHLLIRCSVRADR